MGTFLLLNNRLAFTELSSYWSYLTIRTSSFPLRFPCNVAWLRNIQNAGFKENQAHHPGLRLSPCFSRRNLSYSVLIRRVLLLFQVHSSNSRHICDCFAELGPRHSAPSSLARGTHGVCGRHHALFLQIKLLINC